jgi:hypothetical protein
MVRRWGRRTRRTLTSCTLGLVLALVVPSASFGHAERPAFFPDHTQGSVPQYRTTDVHGGTTLVVCKSDSASRIRSRIRNSAVRAKNLALLHRCAFDHIQEAVDAAGNWDRIFVLPGVYGEGPSVHTPPEGTSDDPDKCKDMKVQGETIPGTGISLEGDSNVPSYEFHRTCPNAQNLIAIVGDADTSEGQPSDPDGNWCDDKCHIQIEGTGDTRDDVLIRGDKKKLNVIRADRADGIYLKNFTIEFSDFNNIYALETNGFRFDDIESRFSREYGLLSFTSDNGLYEKLDAHHSGDSGVYPGSGPEGHCNRYGIEIRNVRSHDNTIGYSGTAGNGIYAHDNRFYNNATGLTTDSFASGHPGMPQDCAKWENNHFYSNNLDLFNDARDDFCRDVEYKDRDPNKVCPTFQVPEGTGLLIAGGNANIVRNNFIYDNWRDGAKLFFVPAAFRGEPEDGVDTSFDNRFLDNTMGVRPFHGTDRNGNDFWWDEQGRGNCWKGNKGPNGGPVTHNVVGFPPLFPGLPECGTNNPEVILPAPGFFPGSTQKQASQAPCAAWDPSDEGTDSSLPGCDWFTNPSEPQP